LKAMHPLPRYTTVLEYAELYKWGSKKGLKKGSKEGSKKGLKKG
jgi:hypothetical protein